MIQFTLTITLQILTDAFTIHPPSIFSAISLVFSFELMCTDKTVSVDVAQTIMKARSDKGLTRKDLATKINEKPTVVQEYETGKAIPNQQTLGKMERCLGVKLRGKDIGKPLEPRGSKAKK